MCLSVVVCCRCVAWDGQRLVVCGSAQGQVLLFDMGAGKVLAKWMAHEGGAEEEHCSCSCH